MVAGQRDQTRNPRPDFKPAKTRIKTEAGNPTSVSHPSFYLDSFLRVSKISIRLKGVEKGFNSDIAVKGIHYHVQTEDWGTHNPYIVSRIFRSGAVVKTVKTPYGLVLANRSFAGPQPILLAMKEQHSQILD